MAERKGADRFRPDPASSDKPSGPVNISAGEKIARIPVAARAPQNLARLVIQNCFTRAKLKTVLVFDGEFYVYEDGRYIKIDPDQVKATISRFIDRHVELKDDNDVVAPTSWHVRETFAALREQVMLPPKLQPPCWISDGEPPWRDAQVLVCRNCVLDPLTDESYNHDPRWFSFNTVAVKYSPEAERKRWNEFLSQVWENDQESKDCLAEFQAATAMQATRFQKILALKGPKRAGKGICMEVTAAILGQERVARIGISDLINDFGLAGIIGKSAVFIGDARIGNNRDTAKAIERLLKHSGGDRPSVGRKYLPNYEGPLDCIWWFSFNILPSMQDGDASGALPNRFQFLRYLRSFFGKEDSHLLEKLTQEVDGIFLTVLAGWKRLHKRGAFFTPEAALGTAYQNVEINTALADFIEECCLLHPEAVSDKDPKTVAKDPLFEEYMKWAERRKIRKPKSRSEFYRALDSIIGIDTTFVRDPVTAKKRDANGKDAPYRVLGIYVRGTTPRRYEYSEIVIDGE
jgi:putative DNA primase/helicase